MTSSAEARSRAGYVLAAVALAAVAAAFWLPRWWEMRLYRQAEALTGVGAPVLSGKLADARSKIDPGKRGSDVIAALGNPSQRADTDGASTHGIWTFYYADGTMTVNLTDDVVVRISTTFGPPKIPTSRRR